MPFLLTAKLVNDSTFGKRNKGTHSQNRVYIWKYCGRWWKLFS